MLFDNLTRAADGQNIGEGGNMSDNDELKKELEKKIEEKEKEKEKLNRKKIELNNKVLAIAIEIDELSLQIEELEAIVIIAPKKFYQAYYIVITTYLKVTRRNAPRIMRELKEFIRKELDQRTYDLLEIDKPIDVEDPSLLLSRVREMIINENYKDASDILKENCICTFSHICNFDNVLENPPDNLSDFMHNIEDARLMLVDEIKKIEKTFNIK